MKLDFASNEEGSGVELKCPNCGSINLHHERIEIFEREEDQDTGLHVSVSDSKASIDQTLKGNPSLRRNGLTIHFWCELCSKKSQLSIAQHKGSTFVKIE